MTSPPTTPPPVRFLIELRPSEGGVTGWLRRDDEGEVPFSSWLELLALLEPSPAP